MIADTIPFEPVPRGTKECREGERAFEVGVDQSQCPYQIGNGKRVGWLTGWYDRRMNARLGHIFRKYSLAFP